MLFDARQIARGWLAVALASGKDKYSSALNRTIHIEEHLGGVRLVATDSYVLLNCWVPDIEHELDPPPGLDEAPMSAATAIDPWGRARGFLSHALRLSIAAEKDNLPPIEVRLRLNVLGEAAPGQLAGMEARSVVVEQPDVERLILDVYDGPYPTWRGVLSGFEPVDTAVVALNPEIVGRLAKIHPIHPHGLLGWIFGGPNKMARVEILNSDPYVDGLVMPCRWDFEKNAPRVDEPEEDQVEDDDAAESLETVNS